MEEEQEEEKKKRGNVTERHYRFERGKRYKGTRRECRQPETNKKDRNDEEEEER